MTSPTSFIKHDVTDFIHLQLSIEYLSAPSTSRNTAVWIQATVAESIRMYLEIFAHQQPTLSVVLGLLSVVRKAHVDAVLIGQRASHGRSERDALTK